MKKGFTMIELIFVIVILGILASVAIPRLAGTREDAEISSAIANLRTLLSDAASYYVVKGDLKGAKWKEFTNVPLENADATVANTGGTAYLQVGGKKCLGLTIKFSLVDDSPYVTFQPVNENNNGVCATVLASAPIKQLLDSSLPTSVDNGFCKGVNNQGVGCIAISSGSIY